MSPAEEVMMNVQDLQWSSQAEMIAELESLDYGVQEVNYEFVSVIDIQSSDKLDYDFMLNLEHTHGVIQVESVYAYSGGGRPVDVAYR